MGVLLAMGCGGDRSPIRIPGPALWIGEESRELSTRELRSLSRNGVQDLFVEVGSLRWKEKEPTLERLSWPDLPERPAAVLVIRGLWPAPTPKPRTASEALIPRFETLLAEASQQGLDPLGIHLDLAVSGGEDSTRSYGRFLERLADGVPGRWSWSATVDPEAPGTEELVEAADFVVAFVYGTRPGGERPGPGSRSFAEARTLEDRLASWDKPHLTGIVTLGTARLRSTGETVTRTDLTQLAWDRALEAGHGFTLEAADRQHYRFEARRRTFVAGQPVEKGTEVEATGTSSAHVAELLRILRRDSGTSYRGPVFYRLPGVQEGLSLEVDQLVHALEGPEAARPGLEVGVSGRRMGPRLWDLAVSLRETRGEPTDLGFVDANWVDLVLGGSGTIIEVEPGNFYRYELLRRSEGALEKTLRRPDVVRLYAPYVPGHGEVRSGPIRIRVADRPRVTVRGSFLAPYGETLDVGPRTLVPGAAPEEGTEVTSE
ncbi:MAG: hypothetical protein R3234_10880 [Thermoanaerobaculia bacterium]|nr:hypothetical protein [Thermoanaerobaculia bacterium]